MPFWLSTDNIFLLSLSKEVCFRSIGSPGSQWHLILWTQHRQSAGALSGGWCFWSSIIRVIQGCESSDFNLIQTFLLFTKPNFQSFNALKTHLFRHFRLFQTFSYRRSHTPCYRSVENTLNVAFLAHLNRRLKWAIAVRFRPSCVVRRP